MTDQTEHMRHAFTKSAHDELADVTTDCAHMLDDRAVCSPRERRAGTTGYNLYEMTDRLLHLTSSTAPNNARAFIDHENNLVEDRKKTNTKPDNTSVRLDGLERHSTRMHVVPYILCLVITRVCVIPASFALSVHSYFNVVRLRASIISYIPCCPAYPLSVSPLFRVFVHCPCPFRVRPVVVPCRFPVCPCLVRCSFPVFLRVSCFRVPVILSSRLFRFVLAFRLFRYSACSCHFACPLCRAPCCAILGLVYPFSFSRLRRCLFSSCSARPFLANSRFRFLLSRRYSASP